MKNFIAIVLICFLGSCSSQNENPLSFIQRIKDKDLSILFNVAIEARGIRDDTLRYYYSHNFIGQDTIDIPSIEFFDDFIKENRTLYLHEVEKLAKNKGISSYESIDYAKKYAQKIDKIYKELKVVNSISLPKHGRFIEFTLDAKCKVFYLEDGMSLTPYWKDKFSNLKKVDEKWYYECSPD